MANTAAEGHALTGGYYGQHLSGTLLLTTVMANATGNECPTEEANLLPELLPVVVASVPDCLGTEVANIVCQASGTL